MTFGEHITTLRKRKGISQGELGNMVGTSGNQIFELPDVFLRDRKTKKAYAR